MTLHRLRFALLGSTALVAIACSGGESTEGASAAATTASSATSAGGAGGSTPTRPETTGTTTSTSSTTTTTTGSTGTGGGTTTTSPGGGGQGGGATTTTGAGGGAPAEPTTTLDIGQGDACFELATGKIDAANPCQFGDFIAMQGANVDLMSADALVDAFCLVPGVHATLASVPKDYASCTWTGYVEGIGGLANTGFIVRDTQEKHHYRMQIVDNAGSTLVFRYDAID